MWHFPRLVLPLRPDYGGHGVLAEKLSRPQALVLMGLGPTAGARQSLQGKVFPFLQMTWIVPEGLASSSLGKQWLSVKSQEFAPQLLGKKAHRAHRHW